MRTAEHTANPLDQLMSREQAIGLYNLSLGVNPLGLYGVLSRGLYMGKRQLMILTPWPLFLTARL
jgi:hypothetical protein